MLIGFLSFLSTVFMIYDTVSHLAFYKKYESEDSKKDYSRLIKTWIFFLALKTIGCTGCAHDGAGFITRMIVLILTIVRLLLTLPITKIQVEMDKLFFDQQILQKAFGFTVAIVKENINKVMNKQCGKAEENKKSN